MTNINIETVAFKCQGVESTVTIADLDQSTIDKAFEYGVRRLVQDSINSAAKNARDNGDAFDAEKEVASFIRDMNEGKLGTRSAGVDSVTKEMRKIARMDWLATLSKAQAKDARQLSASDIAAAMDSIIEADAEAYRARALEAIATREAEAKARAEAIAKAMNAVNAAKIDLDSLLKG